MESINSYGLPEVIELRKKAPQFIDDLDFIAQIGENGDAHPDGPGLIEESLFLEVLEKVNKLGVFLNIQNEVKAVA